MNYNDKGKKYEEGQWKNGELSGKTTMWDKNGVKTIIKSFKKDEKDGLWVWWSPIGNKVKEGSYKLGQKHGKWTFYYADGSKKRLEHYDKDKKNGN